jgi:protoheme IX farnesyltransferase
MNIYGHRSAVRSYLELCKVRISLFSSFSAATGYLLSATEVSIKFLVLMTGVSLLACGSCALNQYQERVLDAFMPRTRNRPMPSGRISSSHALLFSLVLMTTGLLTLFFAGSLLAPVLGGFAVIWYNGVYTLLKKKTAFAVIPGALVGAIPVAMGWVTGGGAFSDPRLLILSFFFFMWQVPHSWLFILRFGDDYRHAGMPSLTAVFSKPQLQRIVFIWISAAAVGCLLVTTSGIIQHFVVSICLFALSAWLVVEGTALLWARGRELIYFSAFSRINTYMFFVMTAMSADKILR